MIVTVYLIIPVMGIVLWIMARKQKLPDDMTETGVSRELLKMALLIYKTFLVRRKIPGSDKVREYLGTLKYSKDMEKVEAEYYIRKISIVLFMLFAGSFLAIAMNFGASGGKLIEDGSLIQRRAFGGGNRKIELVAKDTSGNEIGEFTLDISEQFYTKEEADELFREASDIVEKTILGENTSFDCVSSDLKLVQKLEGYPFRISWHSDNYDVIDTEGKIKEEAVSKEGEIVTLTATYAYDDNKWQQTIYVNVIPRKLTSEEQKIANIKKLLENAETESRYEEKFELPEACDDQELLWNEKTTDNSLVLLLLMMVGGAASFVLKDKELKDSMEERSNQLLSDYPQVVSQLVLYLGAGMTMRNIFEKLADNYMRDRKDGGELHFVYEEITRTVREMAAGMSEACAYESFGLRCGGQQYTRLGTLLSQNLRRGNSELLNLLEEESKKAFSDRLDKIRKAGEEAGTKLLLPMVMMLLVVMVIIMIPAYMSI